MTVEFFGINNMGQVGGINKTNRPGEAQKSGKSGETQGASFSSTLKGASEVQASSVEASQRADRVAELKAQVANGSYKPDLDKVASSLLKFLVEG
ncbi:flagellar biosynthesis anti-sigma factor FlgM [Desulfogranum mediterraneum]|uniref:flagellar biosynthesis anti-sigma factor FlgM n=1 Tax=Desulfogranum mediterraneum TaxID=160661 RepID=UPI0004025E91|nr:flagellar biosynthesis anti-sigma factor FlgM [Desulfogranum mediterraneum]